MITEFRDEIIDHYKNPRNFGELKDKTHHGKGINAACGDMIEIHIKVKGNRSKAIVEEIRWRGVGCAMMTASASLLSEYAKGKSVDEIEKFDENTVEDLIGEINPGRIKCVLLPLSALKQALLV